MFIFTKKGKKTSDGCFMASCWDKAKRMGTDFWEEGVRIVHRKTVAIFASCHYYDERVYHKYKYFVINCVGFVFYE